MATGNFYEDLERGKPAELFALNYFNKYHKECIDVSKNPDYFGKDVDFIVDGKEWEVKLNFINALKGKQGDFIWIELYYDSEPKGWWFKTTADFFLFNNGENKGVIIENNDAFKSLVNHAIESGDHSSSGDFRFDVKKDARYNKTIDVLSMRVYLETMSSHGVNFQRVVNRRKL